MARRWELQQVASETLTVLERGYYDLFGEEVDVAPALERAVAETAFFPAENRMQSPGGRALEECGDTRGETTFEVTNETTIEAGRRLHAELGDGAAASALCVLNFASAKNPGGGFQNGAQAQEESLARSSGLYACLSPHNADFYEPHRADPQDGLYSHAMLYSPGVPFFRDDAGAFCPPWFATVITSPAPNAGVALRKRGREEVLKALRERCSRILQLAHMQGHRDLVLGAFGCGVFKNDPEDVARVFAELLRTAKFGLAFRRIVFAIPGEDSENYKAFSRHFGDAAPLVRPVTASSNKGSGSKPQRRGRKG